MFVNIRVLRLCSRDWESFLNKAIRKVKIKSDECSL